MFTQTLVSLSLAALALGVTINTPTALIECQPAALAWSAGTAPYYVSVLPGGQPSATPLEQLGTFTGTTTTWTVDLAAGVAVTLAVTDSTGAINYSQQVTIQAGTSTSCLSASSGTTAAAAGTTTAATSSGGRTPVSVGATTSVSSAAAAASSKAATTSSASAAASSTAASSATSISTAGLAGFFGVLFAILV